MSVKKVLDTFGNNVVTGARKELSKQGKNASKALSNSLQHETDVFKNSFSFSISMEDYGLFVDAGVEGIGGTKKDGTPWKKKKVTASKLFGKKLKYKKGIKNKPSYKHFNGWTIRRGLAPRSKGGQFTKRRGLMEAISHSVWHTGLETTNFLTNPFNKYFKDLPDEIVEAYGLEVEELLEFSLKT